MNLVLSIKVRLYPKKQSIIQDFRELIKLYATACNYTSKMYFNHNTQMGVAALHNLVYYPIRRKFGLKAQEANSVPRTVKARYKSVNAQLFMQSKQYKDKYSAKHFYINRTVQDLWNPIHFRRPQADLVRKNDYSIVHQHGKTLMSISVLHGRDKMEYYLPKYFRRYLTVSHQLGTAKLLQSGGHWYLHISVTIHPKSLSQVKHLVGNDRGQRFMVYSYDEHRHCWSISGLKIRKKRSHFLKHRAQLQHCHTQSAKRRLKSISGQENGWMTAVNHTVSKTLVHQFPKNTVYALELLRGVKFEAQNAPKQSRYSRATWSFYQLGTDLQYKAHMNQSRVIHVEPQYTSQRCPRCGRVLSINRNHSRHVYHCISCGYTSNDDRIGSMNIQFLGHLALLGYHKPYIRKNNQIGYHVKINDKHYIKYLSRKKALQLTNVPLTNTGVSSRA